MTSRMLPSLLRPIRGTAALHVAYALACAGVAAGLSLWVTLPNLHWYAALHRPSFRLPTWLFGPLWILLHGSMGWALLRLLRSPDWMPDRGAALQAFGAHLGVLTAWPIVFFGLHRPKLSLLVAAASVIAAANAIRLFRRIDPLAARILLPSLAWAIFGLLLNLSIAIRN